MRCSTGNLQAATDNIRSRMDCTGYIEYKPSTGSAMLKPISGCSLPHSMSDAKLDELVIPTVRIPACNAYDRGYIIGQHFASMIKCRLASDPLLMTELLPFASSMEGQNLVQSLTKTNKGKFPDYWDEMCGTADGSGVPFIQIFLLNLRKEIGPFLPNKIVSSIVGEPDQCSDILVCNDTLALLAHNEDADGSVQGHVYLVNATLVSGVSFLAYTYAGELPSCAFGFNSLGMAFTLNAVPPSPEEVMPGGIGRNFVSRDLLEATNLEDALNRVRVASLSVGHNYNLADINLRKILTVETASRGRYSIHEIGEDPYFHANMYLHLPGIQQVPHESSMKREARATQLCMCTREEILMALGDTRDLNHSIFMHGPQLYTLCTIVFDLDKKTLTLYGGNPTAPNVQWETSLLM